MSLDTQIVKQLDKIAQMAAAAKDNLERTEQIRIGYKAINYYAERQRMSDHLAAAYVNKFEFLLVQYKNR